jgi:hypothetical protein
MITVRFADLSDLERADLRALRNLLSRQGNLERAAINAVCLARALLAELEKEKLK